MSDSKEKGTAKGKTPRCPICGGISDKKGGRKYLCTKCGQSIIW